MSTQNFFLVDLQVSICWETYKDCVFTAAILQNTFLPKRHCLEKSNFEIPCKCSLHLCSECFSFLCTIFVKKVNEVNVLLNSQRSHWRRMVLHMGWTWVISQKLTWHTSMITWLYLTTYHLCHVTEQVNFINLLMMAGKMVRRSEMIYMYTFKHCFGIFNVFGYMYCYVV